MTSGEIATASAPRSDVEYDLKIDEQVSKFLELRHKLTFFLVTAAVAPLGYTLSTAISKNAVAVGGRR